MPQLSLYIEKNTIEPAFPVEYEKLAGCIQDDTFKRPDTLDWVNDAPREQLYCVRDMKGTAGGHAARRGWSDSGTRNSPTRR